MVVAWQSVQRVLMIICSGFVLAAIKEFKKKRHCFSCPVVAKPSEDYAYLDFSWRKEPQEKRETASRARKPKAKGT